MTPPPKLTDDSICVTWATQQTKPFKSHAEDRVAFARAIEAARDQQWVEMLARQEPVAWSVLDKRTGKHWYTNESKYTAQHYATEYSHRESDGSPSMVVTPLYTAPHPHPDDTALLREALAALEAFVKYAEDVNDDSPELDRARAALARAGEVK